MNKELKIVVDTNVIISALIGRSPASLNLYNAFIDGVFIPILSDDLIKEIFRVIQKPRLKKYFHAPELKRLKVLLKTDAILVNPSKKVFVCRDAKDNFILEIALAAKADTIVTNDEDLLVLKTIESIPILTPREFLQRLTKSK